MRVLTLVGLFLTTGCTRTTTSEVPREPSGSASFIVGTSQALSAADVASVNVTLEAFDISPNTIPLVQQGQDWTGTMSNIRAGTGRRFYAEAFNSAGVKIFAGEANNVTITAGQTTSVIIIAQEVNGPPAFENQAPVIDSLVMSSPTVEPGGILSLVATAHDPDSGDTLTYEWTATDGAFSAPTTLTTTWTAPATAGQYTLTLTVRDQKAAATALDIIIPVEVVGRGDADIRVIINGAPGVTRILATPTRVRRNQTISVSATAVDPETASSALNYAWSASCTGTWANENSPNAQFTPTALPTSSTCNNCELTVTVSDGQGGVNTGKLGVCVTETGIVSIPPQIASTYQSAQTVVEGNVVRLRVNATDSQGRPLTYAWSTTVGMLGTPLVSNNGNTGEVLWTAPSCLRAGVTPRVSVRMSTTATPNLYTDHTFTLNWGATGRVCNGPNGDLCFDATNEYLGQWSFDTTASDGSPWNRHLTISSGSTTFESNGVWGHAARAQGQYLAWRSTDVSGTPVGIDDATFDFGTSDFTLAMWVNINTAWPNYDSWLLTKATQYGVEGGWSLRSYYGTLYWYSDANAFNTVRAIPGNTWTHIAVVRDSGTLRFYINGQLDSSHPLSTALSDTSAPLIVGARGAFANPMYGMMDELIILNRAATPLELDSIVSKSCR